MGLEERNGSNLVDLNVLNNPLHRCDVCEVKARVVVSRACINDPPNPTIQVKDSRPRVTLQGKENVSLQRNNDPM